VGCRRGCAEYRHLEDADAVGVVELDKVDTTQRCVSHLGFEHEAKEPRLPGRLVDEKVGMPERIARSRHRTESRRDCIPADDGIVSRRVEHDDVRSQLFHGSLHVTSLGRREESLDCIRGSHDDERCGTAKADIDLLTRRGGQLLLGRPPPVVASNANLEILTLHSRVTPTGTLHLFASAA
jgi:hypothetical protein